MPDSSNPISPNYVPGVGRLATDRYDFEAHILGTNFRHNADAINVIPNLTVGSTTCTNVLEALQALAAAAEPPVIAPATQTILGTIQLTRDLGGINGASPIVIGLQGRSVSSQTPAIGNVLQWNGSAWYPQPISGLFTAGGDLGGSSPSSTSSLQYVSNLSGSAGTVSISASTLSFSSSVSNASFNQVPLTSGDGTHLNISAQGTNTGNGGTLFLQGGGCSFASPYLPGSTVVAVNGTTKLQIGQAIHGQTVASFFNPFLSTAMPIGTGDNVIYVGNANTAPTTGNPVGGAILYGQNGQLWIKQSDSTNFQIGSIPVPSTWTGVTLSALPASPTVPANGTLTYNTYATSTTSNGVSALIFPQPESTAIRFDMIFVAKENTTGNSAQYNYSIGFIRNGSNPPVAVGTVTNSDTRTVGSNWVAPTTTTGAFISGNNIIVTTGYSTATTAVWTVITQITVTTAI